MELICMKLEALFFLFLILEAILVLLHYHLHSSFAGSLRVMCFCYCLSILLNFRFVFISENLTFKTKMWTPNASKNKKFHSIVCTIFSTFYTWEYKTFLQMFPRIAEYTLCSKLIKRENTKYQKNIIISVL